MYPFIGFAKDIHNLTHDETRPLILGGVTIPSEYAIVAHSDGDIIYHALASAILGAMGSITTIGEIFSDADPSCKNMDSWQIVTHVMELMAAQHYSIHNIDITIVCEQVRLAPYLKTIQQHLVQVLGIPHIGIKCTRFEDPQNHQIECAVICSLINHN